MKRELLVYLSKTIKLIIIRTPMNDTNGRSVVQANLDWMHHLAEAHRQERQRKEEEEEEEEEEESKEIFENVLLPSRKREREKLGKSDGQVECFGCMYLGEKDVASIPYEELQSLVIMIRKSYGRTDLTSLVEGVYKKYKKIRRKINENLNSGVRGLPIWRKATIMDHFRFHNHDPEMQMLVVLSEIQELRTVAANACVLESSKTKRQKIDDKQLRCYLELVKAGLQVQSKDPSKLAFYSAGAHIDPSVIKQGPISWKGKNMTAYWKCIAKKKGNV
jgi:hypothetical protein